MQNNTFQLPLPVYESHKLDTLQSKDGENFSILIGLDKNLVAELKKYSLNESDVELQNNTSDKKRFGEGLYETWYSKERTPYALVSATGSLAAIVWFGPKPLGRKSLRYLSGEELTQELVQPKTNWHTIVYRAYDPFRGRGLMTPFVRYAMADYRGRNPGIKLWAGIDTRNSASIALASKLGFVRREEFTDEAAEWTAMTLD